MKNKLILGAIALVVIAFVGSIINYTGKKSAKDGFYGQINEAIQLINAEDSKYGISGVKDKVMAASKSFVILYSNKSYSENEANEFYHEWLKMLCTLVAKANEINAPEFESFAIEQRVTIHDLLVSRSNSLPLHVKLQLAALMAGGFGKQTKEDPYGRNGVLVCD